VTPGCLEFAGGGGTISTLTGIVSFMLTNGNTSIFPKLQNLFGFCEDKKGSVVLKFIDSIIFS